MPAVIFYLSPAIFLMLISLFASRKIKKTQLLLTIAFLWKIIASFMMTYIVITIYGFGDLPTYFVLAKNLSIAEDVNFYQYMWGSYLPALLNSFIFSLLPPSIYGLAIVTGLSAFLYNYLLLQSFKEHLRERGYYYSIIMLMFLPALSLQSGYIGKETYILPALGYIFFSLSKNKTNYIGIAAAILLISTIRPYQGAIIVLSLMLAFSLTMSLRRSPISIAGISSLALIFYFVAGKSIIIHLEKVSKYGFEKFLTQSYQNGNLILSPPPQPFTVLQSFRPFPWESHNLFALAQSLENLIVFVFFILALKLLYLKRTKKIIRELSKKQKRFIFFAIIYCAANLFIFSYSSNIGDLSRRHVYYFPILILLGIFSQYNSLLSPIKSKRL